MPGTPPMSSRDIASAGLEQSPGSPTPKSRRISQADYSLAMDLSAGPRLQRSSRWTNEYSTYSVDFANPRCVLVCLFWHCLTYHSDQWLGTTHKILYLLCTIQCGEVSLTDFRYFQACCNISILDLMTEAVEEEEGRRGFWFSLWLLDSRVY
jgi:hypothetical protein